MFKIQRQGLLIVPAYLLGTAGVFACVELLPAPAGIWVAAILALVLITPLSLLHRQIDDEGLHIVFYGTLLLFSYGFAVWAIPSTPSAIFVPDSSILSISWPQIAFLVTQQGLYFGIHAFFKEPD